MQVSGWLFDAYPLKDTMVFWIKAEDGGSCVRLEDKWASSIYVASDYIGDLEDLTENEAVRGFVKSHSMVKRLERITDTSQSTVLKLTLKDSTRCIALANAIEDADLNDSMRLYNVDILPPQSYFYEHDISPLAKCTVESQGRKVKWHVSDYVKSTNYDPPEFSSATLDVRLNQQDLLPKFTDAIRSIAIKSGHNTITLESESERELLRGLMESVAELDPDFLFAQDGDEFLFPFLLHRARVNHMPLSLSREPICVAEPRKEGVTYFSYGRVHYRPSTVMLHGRIHIDPQNSFILDHSSLHGLFEMARICRMTLHTTSRATIGRCLSSLQFYHAHKRGLLVPWKPVMLENLKTYRQLLLADRGGFILEPEIGVHENVAEFDFESLFPNIMRKKNVSGETVNCDCCPDSQSLVPELGYHICEKHRGIVSEALEVPLDNRAAHKMLKQTATDDAHWQIYEQRQGSLKWLGVVSFGYLGHSNSKFGRIDGHIAVCAFARSILKRSCRMAEAAGYTVKHAIVDSLFAKKDGAMQADHLRLRDAILDETGFDISFEGEYKWVAFVGSKENGKVPVPNRYFGVFQDGTIKDRGIETRRHDTPPLFSQFQKEVLRTMAEGNTVREVKALMPQVFDIFLKYKQRLKEGKVPLHELVFTKMLSKDANDHAAINTVEIGSLELLGEAGQTLRAGQALHYIITDYNRRFARRRSIAIEMASENTSYDANRYIEMLAECCNSVTGPFGVSIDA